MALVLNRNLSMNYESQQGVSLMLAMVMIFFLTLIAVSAGNLNNVQQLMARNHQFNNEVFNETYAEIDAQVLDFNTQTLNGTREPAVTNALATDGVPVDLTRLRLIDDVFQEEQLNVAYERQCIAYGDGSDTGVDTGFTGSIDSGFCKVYKITSSVSIPDSSLGSVQEQFIRMQ